MNEDPKPSILDTHVRLREYILDVFNEKLRTIQVLLDEREKQLVLTERVLNERLHTMNDLQHKLDRTEKTMLSVDRFERDHRLLIESIERSMKEFNDRVDRRFVHQEEKIDPLLIWRASVEGRQFRAQIISIVAVIVSALAVVVHFWKTV